jgi:AcrR family transcriptional regulator
MKRKTRKEILYEEAAQLFMEKGYPASSVRELADRVGIEPSSIYSHVKSKEDLLVKICMDTAYYFSEGMNEIEKSEKNPIESIQFLIDLHIDAVRILPASVTVFTDEWKHLPANAKAEFIEIRNKYQGQWLNILKDGIKRGQLKEVNPMVMRDTILSSLRWVHYISDKKDLKKLKRTSSEIKSLLLEGIQA